MDIWLAAIGEDGMSEENVAPGDGDCALTRKTSAVGPLEVLRKETLTLRAEQAELEEMIETARADIDQFRDELAHLHALVVGLEHRLEIRSEALSRLRHRASRFGIRLSDLEPKLVAAFDQFDRERHALSSRGFTGRIFEGLRRVATRRRRNPLFDTDYYITTYSDVRESRFKAYEHYMKFGVNERRNPHPLFDTDWYLQENPDVAASGVSPLWHYYLLGGKEGRDPHPLFSTAWYLKQFPELAGSGVNPLEHYIRNVQSKKKKSWLTASRVVMPCLGLSSAVTKSQLD